MPHLIADHIFTGDEISNVITELEHESIGQAPGICQFKIRAFVDDAKIWEYHDSTSEVILEVDSEHFSDVVDALGMCGARKVITNFSDESMKTDRADWEDWFLKKTNNQYLIPDTNFVYRHYPSGILWNRLGKNMPKLTFCLPRLVVLEIERRANEKKKKDKNKRMAFYAAKEIQFLRNATKFRMIPQTDPELMTSYTERAGKGFADMWIRQEIHSAIDAGFYDIDHVLFLTCDLMNAMAAEAEGIHTCYFSRISQDSYLLGINSQSLLPSFLIANAIIFDEVKLELILKDDKVSDTVFINGMWSGKTTAEWYDDCLKFSHRD